MTHDILLYYEWHGLLMWYTIDVFLSIFTQSYEISL